MPCCQCKETEAKGGRQEEKGTQAAGSGVIEEPISTSESSISCGHWPLGPKYANASCTRKVHACWKFSSSKPGRPNGRSEPSDLRIPANAPSAIAAPKPSCQHARGRWPTASCDADHAPKQRRCGLPKANASPAAGCTSIIAVIGSTATAPESITSTTREEDHKSQHSNGQKW